MSNESICKTCRGPKAKYACGLCEASICKKCTQFIADNFTYMKQVPAELMHSTYCTNCFDETVATPLAEYNETMEKARDIIIYTKDQSKLTRFLKRKEDPVSTDNCEDEQEALMRMSFFAVQGKFNCLIDVQIKSRKVIVGSHKKTIYSATAVPITIDPNEIRGHEDPP